MIGVIEKALKDIPTVECERIVPPIANHVPHLQITWDEKRVEADSRENHPRTGPRHTRRSTSVASRIRARRVS